MAPYHGQLWLKADGEAYEIINHGRTATALKERPADAFALNIDPCSVIDDGGCEGYMYNPNCATDEWAPIDAGGTLDDPPWYSPTRPESEDAIGFWIEEWTGLDEAHVARPISSRPIGGQLGAIGARERIMKLNVLVMASTEKGLEYLYRWLGTTLMSVCATCSTDSIWLRRFCPDPSNLWDGLVELREVGLVEGLQWETDPVDTARCKIRRLSFTLAAGDPCMYLPREEGGTWTSPNVATCLSSVFVDPTRSSCRPDCSELVSQCRSVATFDIEPLGAGGVVVELENTTSYATVPVRVIAYADPLEIGVSPEPCGLPILGEVYVEPLPPGGSLTWDVAGRRILYRDASTGADVDGHGMIDANDPPIKRYFALPCGRAHIVMELGNACLSQDGGSWYYYGTNLGASPTFPSASLWLQERMGCP